MQIRLHYSLSKKIIKLYLKFQGHSGDCPNALQKCGNCQQEIPALKVLLITQLQMTVVYIATSFILLQFNDHMMNECTWIKCPCSSEGQDVQYEVCIVMQLAITNILCYVAMCTYEYKVIAVCLYW